MYTYVCEMILFGPHDNNLLTLDKVFSNAFTDLLQRTFEELAITAEFLNNGHFGRLII